MRQMLVDKKKKFILARTYTITNDQMTDCIFRGRIIIYEFCLFDTIGFDCGAPLQFT